MGSSVAAIVLATTVFTGARDVTADATASAVRPEGKDVAQLVAQGMNNAQMAAQLSLSTKTVKNHLTNVFAKLGVSHRAQAIVRAREAGFGRQVQ